MTFQKYNSIENHYQSKQIMRWLNEFPELANETFILEEKVDGPIFNCIVNPAER